MSYGPTVNQNVVKDDILICPECYDTVDLDCCNIYLDRFIILTFKSTIFHYGWGPPRKEE